MEKGKKKCGSELSAPHLSEEDIVAGLLAEYALKCEAGPHIAQCIGGGEGEGIEFGSVDLLGFGDDLIVFSVQGGIENGKEPVEQVEVHLPIVAVVDIIELVVGAYVAVARELGGEIGAAEEGFFIATDVNVDQPILKYQFPAMTESTSK